MYECACIYMHLQVSYNIANSKYYSEYINKIWFSFSKWTYWRHGTIKYPFPPTRWKFLPNLEYMNMYVRTYKLIMAISNFFISDNVKSKNKQSLVDKILFSVHINCNCLVIYRTCSELRMVNTQANTLDSSVIASRPNTHVIPSKGNNITVAFKTVL